MFKTSAFILKKNDYREYDRIYTVYTQDFGKISLLVRGARNIKSKLSPHLENFGEVRVNFAKGKFFNHLAGAGILRDNRILLKDPEKINFIYNCLFFVDKLIKSDEADNKIYNLLKEVFDATSLAERDNLYKINIYFFWRLVDFLGYRPQLDECALCGKMLGDKRQETRDKVRFDITENIIICGNCAGSGVFIDKNILDNLRKIFQTCLVEFVKTNISKELISITEKAKQIKLSEL